MIILNKKYPCIFCGGKYTDLYYKNNRIGICSDCFSKLDVTPSPKTFKGTRNINYVVSPLFYTDLIRKVIIDLKFNNCYAYADILSQIMCELLKDMTHLSEFDLVIPVPLSKKRFIERGYNQAALIAKPFAEFFGVEYCDNVLKKTRETKKQSKTLNNERFTNVLGAFEADGNLTNKRILLVDDIFTTGSTMSACADALKLAGASDIVGVSLTIREKHENIFNIMY